MEGVFSEAQAAFQQSSCCSQHRPGLAFWDEISIPARGWQYNRDMTSCLGARPPWGSCSQMANKETARAKCAASFLLPRSSGLLCSVGTRTWLSLLILTRLLAGVTVPPWAGGLSPWVFQLEVCVLQPGGLGFGRADLAGAAVPNSSARAVSCRPRADSTAHQLAAIDLFVTLPSLLLAFSLPFPKAAAALQDWQLQQAPAKNAALTPRNTLCGLPGDRDRLHSPPMR